jgi:hypothetical protein
MRVIALHKRHHSKLMVGVFLVVLAGAATVTVFVMAGVAQRLTFAGSADRVDPCIHTQPGALHKVVIQKSRVDPMQTSAQLCERLEITNMDNDTRLVAFGEHEDHQAYDGVSERFLRQGQSLIITLDKAGSFKFHDHLEDAVQGFFVVSAP